MSKNITTQKIKVKGFFNTLIHTFFSKIQTGTLYVVYNDGTRVTYGNGGKPEAALRINKPSFLTRLALYGDIGFCESYMDEDIACDDLSDFITLALINSEHLGIKSEDEKGRLMNLLPQLNRLKHFLRKNSKTRSQKNIAEHYDLSNDFFKLFLDDTMMYSSAIFEHENDSLYEAQKRKIDHLAKKLRITKGAKVLEIGSGWGSMAIHLAKAYECEVTTVTLSREQMALCEERFKEQGVDASVEVLLKDYRDVEGAFDAIISVEMFEAVGKEYFKAFFQKCQSLLKPSGMLVMQIITMPDQRYKAYTKGTDFIQKYIFPGGHLSSMAKILETTTKHTRLNLVHMEELAEDYAKTLHIWHKNFIQRLDEVKALGFDDYFIRMWRLYLSYCEAAFITRNINLVQVAFSRDQNMHLNKGLL